MKFIVNRQEALEAVLTAVQSVDKGKDQPVGCIFCEADSRVGEVRFTCQSCLALMQTRVPNASILEEGTTLLPVELMQNILKKCAENHVSIENVDGSCLEIISGEARFLVATLNPKSYPPFSIQIPDSMIRVKGLSRIARHTLFAIQDNREADLNNVQVNFSKERSCAYTSDGARLALFEAPDLSDGDLKFSIHKSSLQTLSRAVRPNEELFTGIAGKQVVFFNNRLLYSTLVMPNLLIDAESLLGAIQENFRCSARVQAEELRVPIENALALNCERLEIRLGPDELQMASQDKKGSFKSVVPAHGLSTSAFNCISYNPSLIAPYLRTERGEILLTWSSDGYMLMSGTNTKYLLAPLRARNEIKKKSKKAA